MLKILEDLVTLARERKSNPVEGSYTTKLLEDKSLAKEKVLEEINELIEAVEQGTNKINEDAELLLEIKTKSRLFNSLEELVIKNHPYDVPEVIAFPMQFVSKSYGAWIEEHTL